MDRKRRVDAVVEEFAKHAIQKPDIHTLNGIQFGILSPNEIRGMSVVSLTNPKLTVEHGTVYDLAMGPCTKDSPKCSTCFLEIKDCPGHFGHIELPVPIVNPLFKNYVVNILKCFCIKCGKLKIQREAIVSEIKILSNERFTSYTHRFQAILTKCNVVECYDQTCRNIHPKIYLDQEGEIHKSYAGGLKETIIDASQLLCIFSKITDEDLNIIGLKTIDRQTMVGGIIPEKLKSFRPEWLILQCLPVLPPVSRPPNHVGDKKNDDDHSVTYSKIIQYCQSYAAPPTKSGAVKKQKTRADLVKLIERTIAGLFDNSKGKLTHGSGTSKVPKGYKERICGKTGLIRGKMMGKRMDYSGRTVIGADPTLALDEVGIPEEFAHQLAYPEIVTPSNYSDILAMRRNGEILETVRDGNTYILADAANPQKIKTKVGDIVYRKLRNGDQSVFNRQPSLHRGSMMGHKVVILPGRTLRLNLSATTPYNADFDGDEMNLHIPQDPGTAEEVRQLMGVDRMIVASQASKPIMGLVQDALVGCYRLTDSDIIIPSHQFMDCVYSAGEKYVKKLPSLFARASQHYPNLLNGRVLVSVLFPEDFCFKKKNNSDADFCIEQGILISGRADSSIVGKATFSIVHNLYKNYGRTWCSDFISASQWLVNRWLAYTGFSVGIRDFLITHTNKAAIRAAVQEAFNEATQIEQSADKPDDVKEFEINNALNDRGRKLAIDGVCKNNRLKDMVNSGSKGVTKNIIEITGHLGQNNIAGARVKLEIDNRRRTLPCFKLGDNSPITRGFIVNSFMSGLDPHEYFFHSKAGREGVTNTSIKTKETGYMERRLVKRVESHTVRHDGTVRDTTNHIISFSYNNGIDPTYQWLKPNAPTFVDLDTLVARLNTIPPRPDELTFAHAHDLLLSSRAAEKIPVPKKSIVILSSGDRDLELLITGYDNWFLNSIRRILISDIPTWAIEYVDFIANTTVLPMEMIAHRLGLIPLHNPPGIIGDVDRVEYVFDKTATSPNYVECWTSDMLIATSHTAVLPVFDKIPIVKANCSQRLAFTAVAIRGTGKQHSKWSPVCNVCVEPQEKPYTFKFRFKTRCTMAPVRMFAQALDIFKEKLLAAQNKAHFE